MTDIDYSKSKQLQTFITESGDIELSLAETEVPAPAPDEVIVKVEAAPINPSDLVSMFGFGDINEIKQIRDGDFPAVAVPQPKAAKANATATSAVGVVHPAGAEGAGVVIAAGDSDAARGLIGATVVLISSPTYAQFRCVKISEIIPFPPGVPAKAAASAFVNPVTALSMIETMRHEGHKALVHTAGASNLGQMLAKVCIEDGIDLVAIVRKEEQAAILREIGTKYVCDTSSPTFMDDLVKALIETNATIAFDAVAGGGLANNILSAMEIAQATLSPEGVGKYGTAVHKQVYIYGGLDFSPTIIKRNYGMAWSVSGYLVTFVLERLGHEGVGKLIGRVAQGLDSTFKSTYTAELTMKEALDLENIKAYSKRATGEKYLILTQE
jgi:NADPH:quinone reductase-like Zn-dependent oxidoreductase